MTRIRPAELRDAPRLSVLSGQLGYAMSPDLAERRLARFLGAEAHQVLVAAADDGRVVGWIHVGIRDVLESSPRAEILGLIVDEAVRASGVGRALVLEAEAWALTQGLSEVVVRSNVARDLSHPFYERLGYDRTKTQHVYRKTLRAEALGRAERAAVSAFDARVRFDDLPWTAGAPGLREKAVERGGHRVRLVELSDGYAESDWCTKGHVGVVREGVLEVARGPAVARYETGDVFILAPGVDDRHRARARSARVVVLLVEDV